MNRKKGRIHFTGTYCKGATIYTLAHTTNILLLLNSMHIMAVLLTLVYNHLIATISF